MLTKEDVLVALDDLHGQVAEWNKARREFDAMFNRTLTRLVLEGSRAFMSDREMAKALGWDTARMRNFMRNVAGLNPRDGKRALSAQAAEALTTNADLLNVDPRALLTSPLAYLPLGEELRREITNRSISQVHEEDVFPETPCQVCGK